VSATGDAGRSWIGVIGDRVEGFAPHDAIADSVDHAAARLGVAAPEVRWLATDHLAQVGAAVLAGASGVWCAPGSPYRSLDGALEGIRWAREHDVAFLGTCAGFQHGVIEFARHVLGHTTAAHAEYAGVESVPDAGAEYFIDELLCSLVGQSMQVELLDRELCELYRTAHPVERYYCRFGLNPTWRQPLHDAGLRVAGIDRRDGDVRLLRLVCHRCYLLTLFVPQTSSTETEPHPLIVHFLSTGLGATGGAGAAGRSVDQAK
jgi:CTP synthase (UTP-ammonia lyase)